MSEWELQSSAAGMPDEKSSPISFRLDRRDLYTIIRLTAVKRPFRKVAPYAIAGFVFLGHAADGNYLKGAAWGLGVAGLFAGLSQIMYLLYVYLASNETFLVQQQIFLLPEEMIIKSEHSREVFPKGQFQGAAEGRGYLKLKRKEGEDLIFVQRSFEEPERFHELKRWIVSN